MKRIIKSLAAVTAYLILLCYLLGTEAVLLLSPKHIGMFLLGCIILCLPSLEKKTNWKEFREIFKKNAIMAGYLETFVLLFASVSQRKIAQGELLGEFALSLRPVFYGFVCHLILREDNLTEKKQEELWAQKELPKDSAVKKKASLQEISLKETSLKDVSIQDIQETPQKKTSKAPLKKVPLKDISLEMQKPDLSKLTRQEKLIAELVSRGLTNREIGEELYISETTVKKHISNIFEKTGISSRRELR